MESQVVSAIILRGRNSVTQTGEDGSISLPTIQNHHKNNANNNNINNAQDAFALDTSETKGSTVGKWDSPKVALTLGYTLISP